MMTKTYKTTAMLMAVLFTAGVAQAKATSHNKISMSQARAIALKTAPGQVTSAKYDKAAGRYSFDIKQKGNVQEIGVDTSGKIVENKSEGKAHRG
jgi:uncharacterized membrane protein YkoI